METMTFTNGQTVNGHLLEAAGKLFLYIDGMTLKDVFDLLIVPENSTTIRAVRFGEETTVTGYTHLTAVSEEQGGMVSAVMTKA